jgi:hypothetical protein
MPEAFREWAERIAGCCRSNWVLIGGRSWAGGKVVEPIEPVLCCSGWWAKGGWWKDLPAIWGNRMFCRREDGEAEVEGRLEGTGALASAGPR